VLRAGLAMAGALAVPRRARAQRRGADLEAEVCVIGSGPAGAILANALVRRGIATLLVESGPPRDAPRDRRIAALRADEVVGAPRYPLADSRFRGAGGTSNLWTGTCPRLQPHDFEPNAYTPRDAPWPIRYDALEPYYLGAEDELRVRGIDGVPYAPPRSRPFARTFHAPRANLDRLASLTGAELPGGALPFSDVDGRPANVAATHLAALRAVPGARLLCGATVTRLLCDPSGRIEGAALASFAEAPRTARAAIYVVACGGVDSARLLLLSRSARWPDGIGNDADLVGRSFMEHPAVAIRHGSVDGLWRPWSSRERIVSECFLADAKRDGLGGIRLHLLATTAPLAPLRGLGDVAGAMRRLRLTARAEIETEPSPANRVVLAAERRDAFGDPGARLHFHFTDNDRRTIARARTLVDGVLEAYGARDVVDDREPLRWLHHHLGTCRMGDDARTSVVDRDLRVHGTDNLYVAGSAAFVTAGVANPTLTIAALSLRLADHLTDRLRG